MLQCLYISFFLLLDIENIGNITSSYFSGLLIFLAPCEVYLKLSVNLETSIAKDLMIQLEGTVWSGKRSVSN